MIDGKLPETQEGVFNFLAQTAYNAYGATVDFKNYQGLPMPAWEDLSTKIQRAWVNAAKSVHDEIAKEVDRELSRISKKYFKASK